MILNEFNGEMIDEETYWVEIVTYNGEVHTFFADPVEFNPGKNLALVLPSRVMMLQVNPGLIEFWLVT